VSGGRSTLHGQGDIHSVYVSQEGTAQAEVVILLRCFQRLQGTDANCVGLQRLWALIPETAQVKGMKGVLCTTRSMRISVVSEARMKKRTR
jgi:hypothetical protein